MKKFSFRFGDGQAEGNAAMKEILGGKGAGLAELDRIGIPVPPGFTITTEACAKYFESGGVITDDIWEQVLTDIKYIEHQVGLEFGSNSTPLLLSVRSGSSISMPGMMDTILNLGLNNQTVEALKNNAEDARFAYDSYRRFIEMYASVVLNIEYRLFAEILAEAKLQNRVEHDKDLTEQALLSVLQKYKELVQFKTGDDFPQDVTTQLHSAIASVFNSWHNIRAKQYRALHNIPESLGTAVTVQAMVFGNMGETSGTGVLFTRNPSTGENELFGEFLINAQGEDIVAGVRTPNQVTIKGKIANNLAEPSMEELMPQAFAELTEIAKKLEYHYSDMQDIEFTIQKGHLWILQTREGKRSIKAAVKIAIDLVYNNQITVKQALMRIKPEHVGALLHPTIAPTSKATLLAKGLPASPGAASGVIALSTPSAEALGKRHPVILVRYETSPEDISGMSIACGILTVRGGMTSHAAVVARGMGKPCICGTHALSIQGTTTIMLGDRILHEGEFITISGTTGEIFLGEAITVQPEAPEELKQLLSWADDNRRLSIRANAETIKDAKIALELGAEGIGLCRTEHMFFEPDRIMQVRQMIFAQSSDEMKEALAQLLPLQRSDFKELFQVMQGLPVTIRLLDPPLHEFLPTEDKEIEEFSRYVNLPSHVVLERIKSIAEHNPMLGHRGCRLAITCPAIYEMQVQAIMEAATELFLEKQLHITPEIMVPFVFDIKEVEIIKTLVQNIAGVVARRYGMKVEYLFGVMIELPRAALQAGDIARIVNFCSFGTNDLTQTTLGLSRDDATKFMQSYKQHSILKQDPFVSLDNGVEELIAIAVQRSREANKAIKLGVCGEHGADYNSILFLDSLGINYVSCSPYRIPPARLAAGHASLQLPFENNR